MMKNIYYLLLTFAITSFAFGQTACDGATALTIGTQQCGNTFEFGDLFDDSACLGNYDGGDDYIFSYTATTTGDKLDLTITGQLGYTGFAMSQGCPEGGAGTCVGVQTSSGSGALNFESDALIAGEVYYIQISTWPSPQSTDFCLDAVLVPVPSCLAPTSLAVSDITTTTASVTWTANSSEMAWEYQVVAGGAMPAETGTATSENPLALTALMDNTTYDVHVRANCDTDGMSDWSMVSFTTPCAEIVPDYTADMSNIPADSCWNEADSGLISEGPSDLGTGSWYSSNHNGTPSNAINIWSDYREDWLISPVFDLSTSEPSELNIYVALTESSTSGSGASLGSDDQVSLLMTTDGGSSWTSLQDWVQGTEPTDVGEQLTFDLSAQSGSVQFAFWGSEGTIDDMEDVYFHVSQFRVRETPSCLAPTNLAVSDLTATTASLSWSAGGTEMDYEYVVQAAGTGAPTAAGTAVTGSSTVSIIELNANTDYEVYVRSNCGTNGFSLWEGPLDFTTPCEAYSIPYFEGFEAGYTHASTVGGCLSQESISGMGTWLANNTLTSYNRAPRTGDWNAYVGYSNEDWLFISVDLTADTSYTASVYARQDGSTASNSNITISYGASASAAAMTNPIVPATGIVNGDYQLISGAFTPTTSGTHVIGIKGYMNGSPYYISLDDISIDLSPSCLAPTALAVSDITPTTASVSWTANSSEMAWEYQVVASGAMPAETGTATSENPLALTTLTANTTYDVYVRANCGADGTSEWVTVSFTTLPAPIVPVYTNDFTTFPGDLWTEGAGALASGPSGTTSIWQEGGFANNGSTGAAKINIYSTNRDEWLISPMFDLSGGTYYLNLDAAATEYDSSILDAIWGSDDFATLMASTDGGSTWTELYRWDGNNNPGVSGVAMPQISLTGYSATSKFALYAESSVSNEDIDFFIDNFSITTNSLGLEDVNTSSNFTYFPNPVNNVLSIKAQASIDSITVYNMLGQTVVRSTPNTTTTAVDMSGLQTGAYFVQVAINNSIETVRVIKN